MEKISIIIPAYNCEKYIIACLESIYAQKNIGYEVIIIDDGSKDRTNQLINDWIVGKNNYKLITISNHGVSYARNLGMKNSNSELIMFMDSDDLLAENAFEYIETIIENYDFDLFQFSNIKFTGLSPQKKEYDIFIDSSTAIEKLDKLTSIKNLILKGGNNTLGIISTPWGKIYKNSIIKKFNIKFNEQFSMFEDGFFNIDYLEHSNLIYNSNQIIYLYRRDVSTSLTRSKDNNIIKQKLLQIDYLNEITNRNNLSEDIIDTFIFNSIDSVFYFYIYHKDNSFTFKDRVDKVRSLINIDCIKKAINNKKILKNLDRKKKIKYYLLKYNQILIIDFLHKIIYSKNQQQKENKNEKNRNNYN